MKLSDFDYFLPKHMKAQEPAVVFSSIYYQKACPLCQNPPGDTGFVSGCVVGAWKSDGFLRLCTFPEIKTAGEINPGIATVKLLEVKNGQLIGKISGQNARLAYSPDDILELDKEANFSIPLNDINLKDFYVSDTIPEGTEFIASSSGKYYYPILDKKAFNITPKNRLYFKTAEDAKKKGYVAPK